MRKNLSAKTALTKKNLNATELNITQPSTNQTLSTFININLCSAAGENCKHLAYHVVKTHMRFITIPAIIISTVFNVLAPNTMAFGAVATGSMKA